MFFKALFAGIGSGGGVAWSMFGIIFAALGCAASSLISIVLGAIFTALFLAIALGIFYFSYKSDMSQTIKYIRV